MSDESQVQNLVHVVDPYGNLGTIDPSEAQDAIQNGGFRLASHQEVTEAQNSQKFGDGLDNSLKAFGAGAARSATFGASDLGMTASGLVEPETLKQLEERHPFATGAGEVAGIAGMLMTGGASAGAGAAMEGAGAAVEGGLGLAKLLNPVKAVAGAGKAVTEAATPAASKIAGLIANPETLPLANKVLSSAGAHAMGSAVEGAAYGLGQSVSEYALGDPHLNGEKVLSNVGFSSLIGGGLGGILGGAFTAAGGLKGAYFSPKVEEAALKDQIASDSAKVASEGLASESEGLSSPKSFDEIAERLKDKNLDYIQRNDMPSFKRMVEVNQELTDLDWKPLPIQMEAMKDERAKALLSTFSESNAPEADNYRKVLSNQKGEAVFKTNKTIEGIAPGETLTSDTVRGGQDLVRKFTDAYEAEQKELAPVFNKVDDAGLSLAENKKDLIEKLNEAIPKSSKYIKEVNGKLELEPFAETMPFTQKSYNSVDGLLKAINNDSLTLGEVRNLRDKMRDGIDWLERPVEAGQVSKLRKTLMDYIEERVQVIHPETQVRDAFKRYAINEEHRESIERIFGGSISNKASLAKHIKSEDVLDNLFSNTVSVGAAKEILGQKAFDKALGDYMSMQVERVTDMAKNGFSSQKFATFLKKKSPELGIAFAEKPRVLSRLNALADFMRILPDAPSVNPSGTAKTLDILSGVEGLKILLHPYDTAKHIISNGAEKMAQGAEQSRIKGVIEGVLSGNSVEAAEKLAERKAKYTVLGTIERLAKKTSQTIQRTSDSIFNFAEKHTETISGYAGSKLTPKEKHDNHKDLSKKLHALNNNIDNLSDTIESATKSLHSTAPGISSGIQQAAIRATSFLASKVPVGPDPKPLSKPYIPSHAELAKFNRYYDTVQKPTKVLEQVKSGTLTPEALEAIQTVYPKLMDEMKTTVLEKLNNHVSKGHEIPYKTRMSLSMFLGQNLDHSLDQQTIAGNQVALMNMGQAQAQNQAQQQMKVSKSGMSKISQSARLLTDLQSTSQRR